MNQLQERTQSRSEAAHRADRGANPNAAHEPTASIRPRVVARHSIATGRFP
ncbi:hypothetical protein [Lysobacter gummosus]|uniref:hypothetical protein n=1 Tax=Lysobacter gummosus TaxID=262324 RepID=UPI003627278A